MSYVAGVHMDVVAGIIWKDGKLLVAQRKPDTGVEPNKWEFPGGKPDSGETLEQALAREIREELGIIVRVDSLYALNKHVYSVQGKELLCELHAYTSHWMSGELQLLDCQDASWIVPRELRNYSFAAADIPIVEKLLEEFA